jgi:hypothetical protein
MTSKARSDTGPFTLVPEWVLDADISHGALRLYALIGRYANSDDAAWPSRATLASRLRCSKDSVDRWIKELVDIQALSVEHRKDESRENRNLTNMYTLRRVIPALAASMPPPSRNGAATPSRVSAAQNENHIELEPEKVLSLETAKGLCFLLCSQLDIHEQKVSISWVQSMERLMRIDGRTPKQIENCITWVAGNDFWSMNVRSPDKLRKQWDRLKLEAQRERKAPKGKRAAALEMIDKL